MAFRGTAIIFDLDGTLVDSVPDIRHALNRVLEEMDRRPLEHAEVVRFVGNGVAKLVERALEATAPGAREDVPEGAPEGAAGHEVLDDAVGRFRLHYGREPSARTQPYPGVVAALERFRSRGFALGVCTNKPEAPARHVLADLGLERFFGAVVGGDTLPVLKPDPAPLMRAASELGAGPDSVLFVGDSETDCATALAASVPFAFFTEGYRKTPVESFTCAVAFDAYPALERFVLPARTGM